MPKYNLRPIMDLCCDSDEVFLRYPQVLKDFLQAHNLEAEGFESDGYTAVVDWADERFTSITGQEPEKVVLFNGFWTQKID